MFRPALTRATSNKIPTQAGIDNWTAESVPLAASVSVRSMCTCMREAAAALRDELRYHLARMQSKAGCKENSRNYTFDAAMPPVVQQTC